MPEAVVRGVHINYEVIGDSGPWIALTPGSRHSFEELVSLAKAVVVFGYRVLLHDRRNCGASEVAFDGSASEHEVWADDLHELAVQLGAVPLYVGAPARARIAILFAMRHPDALRGLLFWRLTGGQEAADRLAEAFYGQYIKLVLVGGMAAVANSEHFAARITARAANREKLLSVNPDDFVNVMTFWRERFLESAKLPIIGASEADLKSINRPACLIAGNDLIHTPAIARQAASLISHSELHEGVVEKRADNDLLKEWDRKEWRDAEPRIAAIFAAFLKKSELHKAIA